MSKNILIVGLGLLGGSLAKALQGSGYFRMGFTRSGEVRRCALSDGAIEETADAVALLLAKADLVVLALPVEAAIAFLEEHAGEFKKGAVVTDVGSVKSAVVKTGQTLLHPKGVFFAGSHPMAGTEFSGYEHSFREMYDNADVFVCPGELSENAAPVQTVAQLWRTLGCRPHTIDAEVHDELVARTSHALHVVSSAACISVLGVGPEAQKVRFEGCAGGFRDTSRIASSNPKMWSSIVRCNREEVLKALDSFQQELDCFRRYIETGDFTGFEEEFARGAALREAWLSYRKDAGK